MNPKTTLRPSPTAILNPRCDPVFKAIFTQGTTESNFALQDFISTVLGKEIHNMVLQPNEPPVDSLIETQMSFDVSIAFDDGERADLEIQSRNEDYDYAIRAEIQAARILNVSAQKGGNWNAQKAYQISVLNFEYDKDDKNPLSWYTMRKESGGHLGNRLNVIFLDLVKIRRLLTKPAENLTKLEKWGMFFALADDERRQDYITPIIQSEEGIMAADFVVKTMSADEANWWRQNSYWIAERDRNSAREAAIKKGLEQGRAQGLEQGLEQGRAEGLAQAARAMRAYGDPVEKIAAVTGLPLAEVQALCQTATP